MTKSPVRRTLRIWQAQPGQVVSSSHFRCQAPPSTPRRQSS